MGCVFDCLRAAAESPEIGKAPNFNRMLPEAMLAPIRFMLITVAPAFRVISSPNPVATQGFALAGSSSAISSFVVFLLDFWFGSKIFRRRMVQVSELHHLGCCAVINDGRLSDSVGHRALEYPNLGSFTDHYICATGQ